MLIPLIKKFVMKVTIKQINEYLEEEGMVDNNNINYFDEEGKIDMLELPKEKKIEK